MAKRILPHIQLAQLRLDALLQPLGRLMAGLGQLLRRRLDSLQGLLLQLPVPAAAGCRRRTRYRPAPCVQLIQVGQHLLHSPAPYFFFSRYSRSRRPSTSSSSCGEKSKASRLSRTVLGQVVDLAVHQLSSRWYSSSQLSSRRADGVQSAPAPAAGRASAPLLPRRRR